MREQLHRHLPRTSEEQTSCTGKRVSYARFYQQISPAYLLPCNKDGVLQLRLMQAGDYRPRLAKMLGAPITEPHLSDCDFFSADFQFPARIAADMELRQVSPARRSRPVPPDTTVCCLRRLKVRSAF
ncbi:MAG: hypothetical protein ACLR4Z_00405 [Butyricicoccaceae bacterium]